LVVSPALAPAASLATQDSPPTEAADAKKETSLIVELKHPLSSAKEVRSLAAKTKKEAAQWSSAKSERIEVKPIDQDAPREEQGKPQEELDRFVEVKIPTATLKENAKQVLRQMPEVKAVSENVTFKLLRIPNDSLFLPQAGNPLSGQLGLDDPTNRADINAPEAWEIARGSSQVVIAIIDTGMDFNHPDLRSRYWRNDDEIPRNGIDDDGNGFIDDVRGWDFADNDNDPSPQGYAAYHGTAVGAIAAAATNNGKGIAGVDWFARLMPIRVINASGWATAADVARGISYAVANGADIINLSLGSTQQTPVVTAAIADANRAGVVVIAARGNEGNTARYYPACDDIGGQNTVIGVAALNRTGSRASFSNFGPCTDIAALGEEVLTTDLGNGYRRASGTSFAAAFATGAAAIYRGMHPQASVSETVNAVLRGIPLSDDGLGQGRLNLAAVVGAEIAAPPLLLLLEQPMSNSAGQVKFFFIIRDNNRKPTKVKVEVSREGKRWKTAQLSAAKANRGTVSLDPQAVYQIGSRDPIDTNRFPRVTVKAVWEAKKQWGEVEIKKAFLRLTPANQTHEGNAVVAPPFIVDTKKPRLSRNALRVTKVEGNTVFLQWKEAQDAFLSHYIIFYRAGDRLSDEQLNQAQQQMVDGRQTSTVIQNLKPHTTYTFRLGAKDLGRQLSLSEGVSAKTQAALLPTWDEQLHAFAITENSVTFRWNTLSSLPFFDRYEIWYGHKAEEVRQRSESAMRWGPEHSERLRYAAASEVTITGLPSGTALYFAIFAFDKFGNAVGGRTIMVRTSPLPSPPSQSSNGNPAADGGGGAEPESSPTSASLPRTPSKRRISPRQFSFSEIWRQLPPAQKIVAQKVRPLFRQIFGRFPTSRERLYWTARVADKKTLRALRGAMIFHKLRGRTYDPRFFGQLNTKQGLVAGMTRHNAKALIPHINRLFRQVYGGRNPTPSEHAYWLKRVLHDIRSSAALANKMLYHRLNRLRH
jgi:subtilisin family serine protease